MEFPSVLCGHFDRNNNQSQSEWKVDNRLTSSGTSSQKTMKDFFKTSRVAHLRALKPQQGKESSDLGRMFFPVEKVTAADIIKTGGPTKIVVNDTEVGLVCHQNVVYAVQTKCPHAGGPLHLGDIEDIPGCGPSIKCPWHSWTFDLATGRCIFPESRSSTLKVETYPVQMDHLKNEIKIGFKEISPNVFVSPPE